MPPAYASPDPAGAASTLGERSAALRLRLGSDRRRWEEARSVLDQLQARVRPASGGIRRRGGGVEGTRTRRRPATTGRAFHAAQPGAVRRGRQGARTRRPAPIPSPGPFRAAARRPCHRTVSKETTGVFELVNRVKRWLARTGRRRAWRYPMKSRAPAVTSYAASASHATRCCAVPLVANLSSSWVVALFPLSMPREPPRQPRRRAPHADRSLDRAALALTARRRGPHARRCCRCFLDHPPQPWFAPARQPLAATSPNDIDSHILAGTKGPERRILSDGGRTSGSGPWAA